MKKIQLFVPAIAFLLLSSFVYYKTNNSNFIEVYFTRNLDINDLAKMQVDLKTKNIELKYLSLGFDNSGKLSHIKYNVKTPTVGGADESLYLKEDIGFVVNTDPDPKFDIMVGSKAHLQELLAKLERSK